MPTYIAYFRVSTERQGTSGLGLDAQRSAVMNFIRPDQLVGEYTEIESGKRSANRPQLAAALADCKKRKATLVIAKLDRLARNVFFISGLMESGVDFVAVDMPTANRLTIHILAAVAEHEAKVISERTKAALAAAKARGKVLGNPKLAEARIAAATALRTHAPAEVVALMSEARAGGATLRDIAAKLNGLSIRTPRGSKWYAGTIAAELKRVKPHSGVLRNTGNKEYAAA
jgi:DNA invertase Pin-like site-specific DNA recombinase